mgnify:CR=1 FL=1
MRTKTKKRLVILLALTLVLIGVVTGAYVLNARSYAAQTRELLRLGLEAVEAQDHAAALHNLGAYIQRTDSRDPDVLFKYGQARVAVEMPGRQHYVDAIKIFRLVLDIDPKRTDAKRELLDLYWRVGRGVESVELADQFLAQTPDDDDALWIRAVSLQRMRRFDDAMLACENFANITGNAYGYFMMLEIMQEQNRQPHVIVELARKLQAEHPDDARYDLLMGYAYALTDDREAAKPWLLRAARGEIKDLGLLRMLAAQLDRLFLFDESLALLRRTAESWNDPTILRDLVRRLWESDALPDALAELEDVPADEHAADPVLMAWKAIILLQMDQRDAAEPYVEAVGRVSGDAEARAWAIFLREAARPELDPQRLARVCRDALQQDPSNTTIRFSLGVAYEMIGETELALEQWQRCKNERPGWHQPLVRMARAYTQTGRSQQAIDAAAEASARAPEDGEVVIAWVVATASDPQRLTREQADELLGVIDQVQLAIPGEPQTLAIQVELLARFVGKEQAVRAVQQALQREPAQDPASLLRLAGISREYDLGVERDCYAAIEQHGSPSADLVFTRAVAQHDNGQTDAGRHALAAAVAAAEDDDKLAYQLAEARYLDLVEDAAALAAWTRLADAHPGNIQVQRQALASPAVSANRELLDRTIERLKTLTGESGITWRLARARYLLDSPDSAKDAAIAASILNDVARMAPGRVEPQLMLAEAMQRLDNPAGAVDRLAKAADLAPDSPDLALSLAEKLLTLRGDDERAMGYLERVLAMSAATDEHRRHAAAMLVQLGHLDRAVAAFEQAQSKTAAPDVLYASLVWRQGRIEDVRVLCEQMLAAPTAEGLAFAADFHMADGRPDLAQAALTRLDDAAIAPRDRAMVLASHAQRYGTPEQVAAYYRQAIQADANFAPAYQALLAHLLTQSTTAAIDATMREAQPVLADAPGYAALAARWPAVATLGKEPPDVVRPVLVSLLNEPQHATAANALLDLLLKAVAQKQTPAEIVDSLRAVADKYPLYWPAQSLAIRTLLDAGHYERAVQIATRATHAFPADSEAAWLASEALGVSGRWSELLVAAQDWRTRAYRDRSLADQMIAEARLQLGDPGQAIAQLQPYIDEALRAPDENAALIERYARALVVHGQPAKAQALLEPLAQGESAWRSVCIDLASQAVTDRAAAEAWMAQVQGQIPTDATGDPDRLTLASGWFTLSQRFAAPALRDKAVALATPLAAHPQLHADAALLLAFCAEVAHDVPAAEQHYRAVLAANPAQATAANNLAMLLLGDKREIPEAVKLATLATELEPQNPSFQHTRAYALGAAGRYDDAIIAARRAIAIDPMSVEWPLTLAELLVEAGRVEQAATPLAEVEQLIIRGAAVQPDQRDRVRKVRQALTPATSSAAATAEP